MAFDPAFAGLLPYVGTVRAPTTTKKPRKIRAKKPRKPRKMRIRKPRKIRVIKPRKIRVRKPRIYKARKPRKSKKAIAAQTGYRSGMVQGIRVLY